MPDQEHTILWVDGDAGNMRIQCPACQKNALIRVKEIREYNQRILESYEKRRKEEASWAEHWRAIRISESRKVRNLLLQRKEMLNERLVRRMARHA